MSPRRFRMAARAKWRCWVLGHRWSNVATDPMYGEWCHCLRCGDLGCGMIGGPTSNGW
jgi:hypothetical protein